jgi:hypothetical protein
MTASEGAPPFPELMAEVMAGAERFGHRQHVHLTWLAVRRCGTAAAIGIISDGIQAVARYAGAAAARTSWVEPDLAPFPWPPAGE